MRIDAFVVMTVLVFTVPVVSLRVSVLLVLGLARLLFLLLMMIAMLVLLLIF
jgi:hypothetical protein